MEVSWEYTENPGIGIRESRIESIFSSQEERKNRTSRCAEGDLVVQYRCGDCPRWRFVFCSFLFSFFLSSSDSDLYFYFIFYLFLYLPLFLLSEGESYAGGKAAGFRLMARISGRLAKIAFRFFKIFQKNFFKKFSKLSTLFKALPAFAKGLPPFFGLRMDLAGLGAKSAKR